MGIAGENLVPYPLLLAKNFFGLYQNDTITMGKKDTVIIRKEREMVKVLSGIYMEYRIETR